MPSKTLIFIPTYNERENAPRMCEEIHKLGLDAEVLFVDDNSPDETGKLLEELKPEFPRLIVHHREGKLGIGSAHFEAIQWAYDQGYEQMITLDCDFTHSPSDIPKMIAEAGTVDVVVGSRWVHEKSLPGWNIFRRFMTWLGHALTRTILDIPQDASGAFRVYNLRRIPRDVFHLVKSRGYSFFFESLFIFNRNGLKISEVAIVLPARTYGSSKMSFSAAFRSARYIFELALAHLRKPEQHLVPAKIPQINPALVDPQDWDSYWKSQNGKTGTAYEIIAGIYRRAVIKRNLEKVLKRVFADGSNLLHAGCGSGQVDIDLHPALHITALDISPGALGLYVRNNPRVPEVTHGSIFAIPFPEEHFDGVYNLGVMEHFTPEEIGRILREFHRVVKKGGRIVMFWPHRFATSAMVLDTAHFILNRILKRPTKLHPPEITRCQGRKQLEQMLSQAGFSLKHYSFGISDFFIQAVVVGVKF